MAQSGNDWNSFMRSKPVQVAMYGLCVFFCLTYGVDALLEMLSPERSASMIALVGETGYYVMTIARMAVCLVTGVAFGRMAYRALTSKDE